MEYTNENFEAFQQQLANGTSPDSILWELRDAIFCEAFYGGSRKRYKLYKLPFGEYGYLAVDLLNARGGRRLPASSGSSKRSHFLFCSPRNNHINRLYPLYREISSDHPCVAWVSDGEVFSHVQEGDRADFIGISNQWRFCLRLGDVLLAGRLCRELVLQFPNTFTRWHLRKIKVYFIKFFAWKRWWQSVLDEQVDDVYCTFEKSPEVKSFFYAAKELGVPQRVHWIHGLRHASIQATLATELWCMTESDVRFFSTRVPEYCTPMQKRNPEADMLIESVGKRTPENRNPEQPVHFLFLGPGLETSYTEQMRMDDLAIISTAQRELGKKVVWRFRPHPNAVNRFRQELAIAGIDATDFSKNTLIEDLKWADGVGSSWSSLLLDVRETGRPIFWVQSEIRSLGGVNELIEDRIGIHVSEDSASNKINEVFGIK